MASGGMVIVKYLLFFFNFIFWGYWDANGEKISYFNFPKNNIIRAKWIHAIGEKRENFKINAVTKISGLGLIVVGAIIKTKYGYFMKVSDSNLISAPVFLIVIGVVVAFVGFLGCCGAIKENYCMVTTFAVLLGIIFVLEIAAGALAYAYRSKVKGYVTKSLENGVKNYYSNSSSSEAYKKFMNQVQKEFDCCGYNTSKFHGYPKGKVPSSCYVNGTISEKDCVNGLEDSLKGHLVIVGGVGIGIAFIQLIGILFACCLMRSIKKEYEVM